MRCEVMRSDVENYKVFAKKFKAVQSSFGDKGDVG
jgi:hypothetical protein